MHFKILGSLAVEDERGPIEVAGVRRRALLLRLLVSANVPVPDDRLVEDLWDDAPGLGTPSTLASHVSLLRQLIGRDRIVRRSGGYLLVADDWELDAATFRSEAASGTRELAKGHAESATTQLNRALERWRGPPLMDAGEMAWAQGPRAGLEELRLTSEESLVEARLALGEHQALITTIESAVLEEPLRERRWGQLMLALYRSGRQAEALRAYQRLRKILGDELGIEPSVELDSLENAIVLQKPELDWHRDRSTIGSGIAIDPSAPTQAPATQGRRRTPHPHLPARRTQMVGRRPELVRLVAELQRRRVISLTGPGGIGKSRMALEAAWALTDSFREGCQWVELAALSDSTDVVGAVAAALGVLAPDVGSVDDAVIEWLRDRRQLIVLDNCEHVLEAVTGLVDKVASQCTDVTVLTTSRSPLGVAGEVVWPLRPLVLEEAVGLFEERVFEVDAGITITEADRVTSRRICERTDGLPLAIEIAAARSRTLSFADILDLLPRTFDDPVPTAVPERHHSLEASIDWSLQLLGEDQRHLFARLSVFPASFDVAAAVAVGGAGTGGGRPGDVDLLLLVNHSMLLVDHAKAHSRFRLLEAMRDVGRRILDGTGAAAAITDRHCDHYCRRSAEIERVALGPGGGEGLVQFALEWDNLRAALDRALERGDLDQARILVGSTGHWAVRNLRSEHRIWTHRTLSLASDVSRTEPVLLALAARWAGIAGDHRRALALATDALDAATTPEPALAFAWVMVAFSSGMLGHRQEATQAILEAESALASCGDPFVFLEGHAVLHPLVGVGFPERYAEHRSMVVTAAAELDNPLINAIVARMEVVELIRGGELSAAVERLPQALQTARLAGVTGIELDLESMALASVSPEDPDAPSHFLGHLSKLKDHDYGDSVWGALELLGIFWARQGQLECGGTVLGHLVANDRRYPNPVVEQLRARFLDPLRESPGAAAGLAAGATMTRNDVLNYALDELADQVGSAGT
ncbi:MAG: AfsR/SARP family transcriptional regulator [Acidimicrobiales bacterium]